jgi:hypothetical protein
MASPEAFIKSAIEAAATCPVYPLVVTEDVRPPYVMYGRNSTSRELELDGLVGKPVGTFDVEIYSDSYTDVKARADAIRAALHNFTGTANGCTIDVSNLTDEKDGPPVFLDGRDVPTYLVEHTYEIRWSE